MSSFVQEINDIGFEHDVLEAQQPFLLELGAQWCGPCRALYPLLEQLAGELRGRLRVGKLDTDDSPLVAERLRVRGVPTLVLFEGGVERARSVGMLSRAALQKLVAPVLPQSVAPAARAEPHADGLQADRVRLPGELRG